MINILDHIYVNKFVHIIMMKVKILNNIIRKCILKLQKHWNPMLWLLVFLCFFKYAYYSLTLRLHKIFIVKIPKDSRFIFLVLNAVFITVFHVEAVQDDISAKYFPIWLHHTVCLGRCQPRARLRTHRVGGYFPLPPPLDYITAPVYYRRFT